MLLGKGQNVVGAVPCACPKQPTLGRCKTYPYDILPFSQQSHQSCLSRRTFQAAEEATPAQSIAQLRKVVVPLMISLFHAGCLLFPTESFHCAATKA